MLSTLHKALVSKHCSHLYLMMVISGAYYVMTWPQTCPRLLMTVLISSVLYDDYLRIRVSQGFEVILGIATSVLNAVLQSVTWYS